MNEDKLNRAQRAARASTAAANYATRRCQLFFNTRNGISVKLAREEERAALARCKS
jgi:hypothetical protein